VLGCNSPAPDIQHHQLFAFGTLIELTFAGVSEQRSREVAQLVDGMYQRQHRDRHAWQHGHLMDLNEAIAGHRAIRTQASILDLIQLAQHFETISQELFNAGIGDLLNMWNFQQDGESAGVPPSADAIRQQLERSPSTLDLQIERLVVRSSNPAVRLDFGGFARGFSVAKAVQLIEQNNIDNFIVNAGGDPCARTLPPHSRSAHRLPGAGRARCNGYRR
jgi:thiamine biosynthesis lipoprotein